MTEKKITEGIVYIGVNDHGTDLFEGQYPVPFGMSYNSYVILDEAIAVMDTVDVHFTEEWLKKLEWELSGRKPDYLVVHHMEPDNSAGILKLAQKYPEMIIVSSAKAFSMMKLYFGTDFADRRVVAAEGTVLKLGTHELTFAAAPMVHWPEVLVSYDSSSKILFSADAFGKFGALDVDQKWTDEARRYYIGIVGKFGVQVQALLKKAAKLDIQMICPLHGPVLTDHLEKVLELYGKWSSYEPEAKGTVIAYASVYGNTRRAALELAEYLRQKGETISVYDLARDDMAAAVADSFRFDKLVLAAPTYNGDVFPFMRDFITRLLDHNYQKRTVGLIENGSWAPAAAKVMTKLLEGGKNLTIAEPVVRLMPKLNEDSRKQLETLAKTLIECV